MQWRVLERVDQALGYGIAVGTPQIGVPPKGKAKERRDFLGLAPSSLFSFPVCGNPASLFTGSRTGAVARVLGDLDCIAAIVGPAVHRASRGGHQHVLDQQQA